MSERYFVDQRGGCIAVRDRELTDPYYQGLHSDTTGVVWYAHGQMVRVCCPTCNHITHSHWEVSDTKLKEAQRVCAQLNAADAAKEKRHA